MKPTAERIFYLLDVQNKSQQSLANYLGLSKQTISGWKNPKNVSYNNYIKEIADFFEVSTDYLLNGSEIKKEHPPVKFPEGAVDKMIEGAIDNAVAAGRKVEFISIKATAKEWFDILSKLSEENLIKLKEYADLLLLQQDQAAQK